MVVERPIYYTGCIAHGVCVNIPPPPAGDGHLIVVSLLRQHLWAYDHGRLLLQTDMTTGRPALPTTAGHYHIFDKQSPFEFISPWPPGSPYYDNPAWVSYAMEFIGGTTCTTRPGGPGTGPAPTSRRARTAASSLSGP